MKEDIQGSLAGDLLLVEDDIGYAALIQRMLRADARTIHHVETLADAEALLQRDLPLVAILLDVRLPDGTGLDGVRRLQPLAPDTALVVLTSIDDGALGQAAIQAGAEDFLRKDDLTRALLIKTIAYAVERNRRMRQLRRREAELRELFTAHPDALLVVSEEGRIESVSRTAATLLGQPTEALIGAPPPFVLKDDQPTTLSQGEPGGEERRMEVLSSRVLIQDRAVWLCAVRDITDREHLRALQAQQEQAERLATLGQFAAGMAHELNNPATVLLSNLEMLREDMAAIRAVISPSGRRLLESTDEILAESLDTMHRIIQVSRSLQDLSRSRVAALRELDLNGLVQRCCSFTRYRTRHLAQLQLSLQPLPSVVVDEEGLSQVLFNLILNAAEAIPEGAAQLHHITVSTALQGEWICLSVSDTGPGVPEAIRERIFEPFFTTHPGQGTGLGLALARQVVQRHRGEISYQPTPDGGACFQVRLPVRSVLAPLSAQQPVPPSPPPAPPASQRVLLIDDEPLLRDAMARLLRPDCVVVTAADGQEAMALLRVDDAFDAIISDLMMPGADGAAVAIWLRAERPQLYLRLLIYTGGAVTERLRAFLAETDRPVLFKPLTRRDLLEAIARLSAAPA